MAGGQRLCPFLERNVFVPGLAGLFFFAFGEEIRWGQRIIGWEAPEALRTANRRQPLTIWRSFKGGESLLHRSRWFELFWPGYCVVLPLRGVAAAVWRQHCGAPVVRARPCRCLRSALAGGAGSRPPEQRQPAPGRWSGWGISGAVPFLR